MKVEFERHSLSPGQIAWKKFKHNRLGMFGLTVLIFAAVIAILGANIRPDSAEHANSQQISIARKNVGFKVSVIRVERNVSSSGNFFWDGFFFGGLPESYDLLPIHSVEFSADSVKGFLYGGAANIRGEPFAYHVVDVSYAVEPQSIARKDEKSFTAKSIDGTPLLLDAKLVRAAAQSDRVGVKRYLLGTDKFGRDMLSRLMAGTIISLSVGLISVAISLILGVSLGAVAGYYGGWIDDLITWLINVIWSIPTLLLVIAITFALGKGFTQVFIAVGLTMWVEVARIVRGQMLSAKHLEYVEAARVLGYNNARIIVKHILPNILGPVIVISSANFASAILLEAGLSFLGIGAQIPMASWGQMIKEHYAYITTDMAYLAILPGLCILVLVMAFMLIGNALRDSFDYRVQ